MIRVALTIDEAAEALAVSDKTIRRALHQTEPGVYPPPIAGKKDSKGKVTIAVKECERWHESLDDA